MARHHMAGTADRPTRMLISRCPRFLRDAFLSTVRIRSAAEYHASFETKRREKERETEKRRNSKGLLSEQSVRMSSPRKDHPNAARRPTIGELEAAASVRFYGNVSTIGRYQMANCCALEKTGGRIRHDFREPTVFSFYGGEEGGSMGKSMSGPLKLGFAFRQTHPGYVAAARTGGGVSKCARYAVSPQMP